MESDPAEKYPVVCHAVLGRRALPAAGGGHMTKGSPEQKSPVMERCRAFITGPCQNSYFSSHTWKI